MHRARHKTGNSSRWLRPRALSVLAVAGVGLAAAIWLPGRNDVASAAEQLPVFTDDFSGARGAAVDPALWLLDGDTTTGVQNGSGQLTLTRLLRTKPTFSEPEGHAEAQIQVSRSAGVWRAFSVLDADGKVLQGKFTGLSQSRSADPTRGDKFHLYAIDWTPTTVTWSVDGQPSLQLARQDAGLPIFLVLNLTTGRRLPTRMVVDFVHVTATAAVTPSESASQDPSADPSDLPPADPGDPSESPTADPTDVPTEIPSESPSPSPTTAAPTTAAPTTAAPTTAAPTTAAPTVTAWKTFTNYAAGDLVSYDGVTYQVLEAHTSLPGWEPPNLPLLFKKV